MYKFYLGKIRVPTPGKLEIKVKGANKVIRLANDGEMNLIRQPGLTEFRFKLILPMVGGEKNPDFYLKYLEELMISKNPFQFIINRSDGYTKEFFAENLKLIGNMSVTLESFDVIEDANSTGIEVNVTLKKYVHYATKEVELKIAGNDRIIQTKSPFRPRPFGIGPKIPSQPFGGKEDTVHNIAKKYAAGKDQVKIVKSTGEIGTSNRINADDKVYLDVGRNGGKKSKYNRFKRPVMWWSEIKIEPSQKSTALGTEMKKLRKSGKYRGNR